jgi:hypothetical protein
VPPDAVVEPLPVMLPATVPKPLMPPALAVELLTML